MGATKNEHGEVVEIPEYIRLHPELPEQTKSNMMRQYNAAKASYGSEGSGRLTIQALASQRISDWLP